MKQAELWRSATMESDRHGELARQVMEYCARWTIPVIEHAEDVSLRRGVCVKA